MTSAALGVIAGVLVVFFVGAVLLTLAGLADFVAAVVIALQGHKDPEPKWTEYVVAEVTRLLPFN